MSSQLHKRLPKIFVEGIIEAFNDHWISEGKACEMLEIKRARLYELRKNWLHCMLGKKPFKLYNRQGSAFHRLPKPGKFAPIRTSLSSLRERNHARSVLLRVSSPSILNPFP